MVGKCGSTCSRTTKNLMRRRWWLTRFSMFVLVAASCAGCMDTLLFFALPGNVASAAVKPTRQAAALCGCVREYKELLSQEEGSLVPWILIAQLKNTCVLVRLRMSFVKRYITFSAQNRNISTPSALSCGWRLFLSELIPCPSWCTSCSAFLRAAML